MTPFDPEYVEHAQRKIADFERQASTTSGRTPKNTLFQPRNGAATMHNVATEIEDSARPPQMSRQVRVPRKVTINGEPANITPLSIVQAALASGNVEMYREAVALAKDMDAITARKAFGNAMAAARAEIPVIRKNRRVGFDSKRAGAGRTDYAHEDMAEIARTVDPILSKYGLHYRFRTTSEVNEPIAVTCIISHRDGHLEETTLRGARDDSGNKNSLQAIGSAVTYLQRYTLKAALGLSAAEEDDDGNAAAASAPAAVQPDPGCIDAAQAAQIRKMLDDRGISHTAYLRSVNLPSIEHIGVQHFARAIAKITNMGARS